MKKTLKIICMILALVLSGFILCYFGFLAPYNLKDSTSINIQSFSKSHSDVLSEYFEFSIFLNGVTITNL